ncbi:hypothetical protein TWF696_004176 [Orbilia brochopaga]|uniref:AA9 family lytic polysaccharide monooxygenase n=1 Tax=Orbilia brochopaga TaxID=3140254 RepID=A0AAV9V648_9PEZI
MVAFSKLVAAVVLAGSASAHTIFQQLWVNGVAAGQNVGIRVPTYNGPITDVSTNDIICNGGPNPLATPLPSAIINVPSGATLTMEWHHGGNGPDPNDASDPVDPSHKGPIMVYLAKVDNALTTTVTGLKWFKIYEDGLDVATNTWAVDKFYANKGFVDFKIPTCIPPGNYLLRGELLALHGAGSYPGAQFYLSCAQINIVGGGSSSPPTVNFPGAYSGSDPGILLLPTTVDVCDPRPPTIYLWRLVTHLYNICSNFIHHFANYHHQLADHHYRHFLSSNLHDHQPHDHPGYDNADNHHWQRWNGSAVVRSVWWYRMDWSDDMCFGYLQEIE